MLKTPMRALALVALPASLALAACNADPNETPATAQTDRDTVAQAVATATNLSTLSRAITDAQLAEVLDGSGSYTLFAPNDDAFAALTDGRTILDLAEGLQLRRARVMGANRIELTGFTDTMRDRLKAYGLFGEIISWKFRLFVPTDASGAAVLARLLERFPVERIAEREAA